MQCAITEALRAEFDRFALAYACEDCLHFVHAQDACDLMYPTAPHRRAHLQALLDGEPVAFCKMFEAD